MIPALLATTKAKAIAGGIIAAGLLYSGWYAHKLVIDAEAGDRYRAMVKNFEAAVQFGHEQGVKLEQSLAKYRADKQTIDDEVEHATSNDAGNRFNADSVRRAAARIQAGKSARQLSR